MKRKAHHRGSLLFTQFLQWGKQLPEKKLFTFLQEKEPPDFLTGKDLVHKTKMLGSILQHRLAPQEKVLLFFPQGLAYIYSLLACLYANVIAIPISITDVAEKEQVLAKLSGILIDSQAGCILTDTYFKEFLTAQQVVTQIPFIKEPEVWLKTIDQYQATHTAAPNFAFDYCCSSID